MIDDWNVLAHGHPFFEYILQFGTMPGRFARKAQCVELCRGRDHVLAVEDTQTKKCHCLKNDPGTLGISIGTASCAAKQYHVRIDSKIENNLI